MKILNSYEVKTLDGITLYCGDMQDGCTWFTVSTDDNLYTTIDDLENGGFTLDQVHKCKVVELTAPPTTLDQFVGHVNSFIDY